MSGHTPCTLEECPPGPFRFGDHLGFKTEYRAVLGRDVGGGKVEFYMSNYPEAYVMASGEFFWGGATSHDERSQLIVQPIDPDTLTAAPDLLEALKEIIRTGLDEEAMHGDQRAAINLARAAIAKASGASQ